MLKPNSNLNLFVALLYFFVIFNSSTNKMHLPNFAELPTEQLRKNQIWYNNTVCVAEETRYAYQGILSIHCVIG